MRALLIVNPHATATSESLREQITAVLTETMTLEVRTTTHRGHAGELAQWARDEGFHLVIAHGGDGTVNEAVNGLLGPPSTPFTGPAVPSIAVIPGGAANVFAGTLGLPRDPLGAARALAVAAMAGSTRSIGLAHALDRWFTFNSGIGWDAAAVHTVEQARAAGKKASDARYARAAVARYLKYARTAAPLTITLPDREPITGPRFAFVSNASPWTYLGSRPLRTNPGTSFDRGLGVFGLADAGVWSILKLVRRMLSSTAEVQGRGLFRVDDVPWVTIDALSPLPLQMDGDYVGQGSSVTFRSVPDAITVVAPAN